MNFSFSEDQRMLADGVRDFLAEQCTSEHVAQAWMDGPDRKRLRALAELGVVGLLIAPEHGGLGMSEVDLTLLVEECGYAGLPEPLAAMAAVAAPLLAEVGGRRAGEVLTAIASGEAVVLPALAADPVPAHLATADWLLLQRGAELHLVKATSAIIKPRPNVDLARPTGTVEASLDASTLLAGDASAALTAAAARGAWATAAELVGTGRRLLDLSTAYAQQREQFGRPIGSFQAVKHHLASALVSLEFARPLTHRAAFSLSVGDPAAPLHASMAKAAAAEAAQEAAKAALQVHGAIGYTWEHPLHLFMKRAWSLAASWGTTEHHWQQIEAATLSL